MTRRTAIASMLAAPVLANAATEPTPPTVTYNVGAEFIPTDIETEDWTILLDDQTGCVYITVHRDDVDFAVIEVFYKTTRCVVAARLRNCISSINRFLSGVMVKLLSLNGGYGNNRLFNVGTRIPPPLVRSRFPCPGAIIDPTYSPCLFAGGYRVSGLVHSLHGPFGAVRWTDENWPF